MDRFLNGEYSKMYTSMVYGLDIFKKLYFQEKIGERTIYNSTLYVIAHSQKYFTNEILPLITNASEEAIKTIKDNEYDQPPDFQRQLLHAEQGV